ncbi:thiamine phosphate synthase [Planctomycetota bacterium]
MERSVYRIIDANFNRAREAIRMMEEFCRFVLNSGALSGRAKQLRHQLCGGISRIDSGRLISSRDTVGDVGVGLKVNKQLRRRELNDCLAAACRRLTEALRAIAEVTQTIEPSVAKAVENLRYSAYTLEKDILLFSEVSEKFKQVRLYIIITSNLPCDIISLTGKCVLGGADCIQLRAKDIEDDKLFAVAVEFVRICRDGGVLSVINDRVDIAAASGADGVHLGQNDLSVEQARKLELQPLVIGKSTHSIEELRSAIAEQPTYVSLGPIFATPTKPGIEAVGLKYLTEGIKELADTGIGHVAIGGIKPDNVEEVLSAAAATIAVCSAVMQADDPAALCRQLKEKISHYYPAA